MFTTFAENKILDAILGRTSWSKKPTVLYFGLKANAGGVLTEITTSGGYARAAVACNNTKWAAQDYGVANLAEISWPVATASWGNVAALGIYTAATGGTEIASLDLPSEVAIDQYGALKFPAGGIYLPLTGSTTQWYAQQIMMWVFAGQALPAIPQLYFALGTGLGVNYLDGEPVASGYERLKVANNTTNWPNAANGSKALSGEHAFKVVRSTNWPALNTLGLYDTFGPKHWTGTAVNTVTFTNGDNPFQVGDKVLAYRNDGAVTTTHGLAMLSPLTIAGVSSTTATISGASTSAPGGSVSLAMVKLLQLTSVSSQENYEVLTKTNHGLKVGDEGVLSGTLPIAAGSSPAPATQTMYYVVSVPTDDTFILARVPNGDFSDYLLAGSAVSTINFNKIEKGNLLRSAALDLGLTPAVGDIVKCLGGSVTVEID